MTRANVAFCNNTDADFFWCETHGWQTGSATYEGECPDCLLERTDD